MIEGIQKSIRKRDKLHEEVLKENNPAFRTAKQILYIYIYMYIYIYIYINRNLIVELLKKALSLSTEIVLKSIDIAAYTHGEL